MFSKGCGGEDCLSTLEAVATSTSSLIKASQLNGASVAYSLLVRVPQPPRWKGPKENLFGFPLKFVLNVFGFLTKSEILPYSQIIEIVLSYL